MRHKLLITGLLILVGSISLVAAFIFIEGHGQSTDHTMLVLLVDPSEHQPSIGAVDFAFVLQLKNDTMSNMTPIYPTGPPLGFHPTVGTPMEMSNVNVNKLYLHDSLYDVSLDLGAKHAQEIVEYNKGLKTDSVVIVKPAAVDAILESIGGVEINGTKVTNDSESFLREEQLSKGIARPDIVQSMGYAIRNASKDGSKRSAMIQAIIIQYSQGNIIIIPNDLFFKIVSAESIKTLFG